MKDFSQEIKKFIEEINWIFAKTYAKTWPHEYIVSNRVNRELFIKLAQHIWDHGYVGNFYKRKIKYFDEAGFTYWTMRKIENPVHPVTLPWEEYLSKYDSDVINRCPKENTYEERLKRSDLPLDS